MNKKEMFKAFAKNHPELVTYVKNNTMSWQKFYEIYDIYGEDMNAWKEYITPVKSNSFIPSGIEDKLKNIDMNSIQEHIKTAQKALALVSELTASKASTDSPIPKVPRPINKFFED